MQLMRNALLLGLVAVTAGISGCTPGGGGQTDTYKVTGTVTLNGNPVPGASVTFSPQSDEAKLPVAFGRTDSQGKYSLTTYDANDGAAAGEYVVMISKNIGSGQTMSDEEAHEAYSSGGGAPSHGGGRGGKAAADAGSGLPQRYSQRDSGLTATVTKGGENNFVFDLE